MHICLPQKRGNHVFLVNASVKRTSETELMAHKIRQKNDCWPSFMTIKDKIVQPTNERVWPLTMLRDQYFLLGNMSFSLRV